MNKNVARPMLSLGFKSTAESFHEILSDEDVPHQNC